MSSTTGGQTNKSNFSHVVQVELRVTYAFHLRGMEYLLEMDLTNWQFRTKHQDELGFKCWKFGPFKFASMSRNAYDNYLAEKILAALGPLGENLEDKSSRMSPVSPTEVPPKDALN